MKIDSHEALRRLYPAPGERAVKKQLSLLDAHCQRFIALSPFAVVSTVDAAGTLDASPRGGAPGFIQVLDERTLLVPDSPGNNRLDTLENIVDTGRVGMLLLIPGVDETLRVNGTAELLDDAELLERCADERRTPKLVIRVTVEEVFLHCAKALMRSALWSAASRVERSALPTLGEMLNDQTGIAGPVETQAQMRARYEPEL